MRRFAALISLVAALSSARSQVPPAVVGPKLGKPIEFELPSQPDDAVLAGNGRVICFTCPAAKRFAIVDVTTAAIAKTIPMTEDDAVVAGTLSRLYVLSQRTRTIQGYKLDSLEADGKSKAFPKGMPAEKFAKAVSAPGANGAIFLYFPKGKVTGGLLPAGAPTFGTINWKHFGPNNAWGPAELHVSHAGTLLIGYGGGYAGMESAVIRNNRAEIWDDKFTGAVDWAIPSADGQFIYTAGGHLARNMTYAGGEKKGAPYTFPSVDPGFYFTVPSNAASKDIRGDGDAVRRNARGSDRLPDPVLYSSDSQKIAALIVPNLDRALDLPPEKRIFFYHAAKTLVTVGGAEGKTIRFESLVVKDELDKTGGDYLLVVSAPPASARRNNRFTYALDVLSKKGGVAVKIDRGEPGMKMNGTTLVWDVPGEIRDREVFFRLNVSDASGKSVLHTGRVAIFNP